MPADKFFDTRIIDQDPESATGDELNFASEANIAAYRFGPVRFKGAEPLYRHQKSCQDYKMKGGVMAGSLKDRIGMVACFNVGQAERLEISLKRIVDIGLKKIRVYISWYEWEYAEGRKWIEYFVGRFIGQKLEILPDFTYTPEELGEIKGKTNSPPAEGSMRLYGKFISDFLAKFGENVSEVELWNEPNLDTDWNPGLDPDGRKFVRLIAYGSEAARRAGKKVVLGGMNKLDFPWLERAADHGLLEYIDIIGIHGLRGTWSDNRPQPKWPEKIRMLRQKLSEYGRGDMPVWLTETGFPPIDIKADKIDEDLEKVQVAIFADHIRDLIKGSLLSFYWYSLLDLPAGTDSVRYVTTGWEDVLQHHFGVFRENGEPKLLGRLLMSGLLEPYYFIENNKLWHLSEKIIERGEPF